MLVHTLIIMRLRVSHRWWSNATHLFCQSLFLGNGAKLVWGVKDSLPSRSSHCKACEETRRQHSEIQNASQQDSHARTPEACLHTLQPTTTPILNYPATARQAWLTTSFLPRRNALNSQTFICMKAYMRSRILLPSKSGHRVL